MYKQVILSTSKSSRNTNHNPTIRIPTNHRILSTPRPRILEIPPPLQELPLPHNPGQLPCHRPIDILHSPEVRRKKYIKKPLLYIRSGDGYNATLVACLHDRGVETSDGIRKMGEIGKEQLVQGKVGAEDVEKLQKARGDVFRECQVPRERQVSLQSAQPARLLEWVRKGSLASRGADAQETRRGGVEGFGVEFVEVALAVDEDGAL